MFVHLHGYSTFSFLESIGKPKAICEKAKALGQPAIALTDLNVMYGAIQHYQAAKEVGIKPIIGVEVGFVLDIHNIGIDKAIGSLVLIAQTSQGYLQLLKLITYANQEGITKRPKIDLNILRQHQDGLLAICGGLDSWIFKMLQSGESYQKIEEILIMLKGVFWDDRVYLEILAQDEKKLPEVEKYNQIILQLSALTHTPCTISNIYAYPEKEQKITQELAMAIKDNLKLYDPQHRTPQTENHIMSEEEITTIAYQNGYTKEQIATWIANTVTIAESCDMQIEMGQALFPEYSAEDEVLLLYTQYQDKLIVKT